MGVNTNTYLPGSVDLEDLARAIQLLTDADDVRIVPAGGARGLTATRGETYVSGYDWFDLYITRDAGFGDGDTGHSGAVWFNQDNDNMRDAINVHGGNASAFWAGLGRGLVDLFGGIVDYNDCDSTDVDYRSRGTVYAHTARTDSDYARRDRKFATLTTVVDAAGLRPFDKTVGLYNRLGEYRERSSYGTDKGRVRVYPARVAS